MLDVIEFIISNKSSNSKLIPNNDKLPSFSPNWVTGFTDAEGCFSVIFSKISALKWRITVSFEINLHSKDILILRQRASHKNFWGRVGYR